MGSMEVQCQPGQIVHKSPSPKTTRAKWAGGMAQAVECLLCKCKALSSNSRTKKKKKKGRKKFQVKNTGINSRENSTLCE
jgi:hypothetical protein